MTTANTKRNYTSRTMRMIAYLWLSFPASYLIYAMAALSLTTSGIVRLILSPSYWLVCAGSVLAGVGILRIRWYGWYAFLLSNFMIAYETMVVLAYHSTAEGQAKLLSFAVTVALQILLIIVIAREIRVPYFFPRIRWWESDPRYKLSVQTQLTREDRTELSGEIMDLSLGGCFVKTHTYFASDELVALDFVLFDRPVHCRGRVVWRTESTVTHPKGIGVKFEGLNKEVTFAIKQATQKLRKLARVYNQLTRERNWQEYLEREQGFQKNKVGGGKR